MFAIEEGPFGLSEGSSASFTLVALYAAWRLADLFKVRFGLIRLQLPVIWASGVWTNRITSYNVCYTKLLRKFLDAMLKILSETNLD